MLTLSRREMLLQAANGFGGLALATLLSNNANAQANTQKKKKITSVIFLYMDGGVSQMDSFDPKPMLDKYNGQPLPIKQPLTQFNNQGNLLRSLWEFKPRGKSGLPISELFPEIAKHADDMCVIRSMTSNFSEHTNANYFLHTGNGQQGRPSVGSWVTYGLGTENQNLPGFIVLGSGLIPPGGLDNFNSGYLPPTFQGSIFKAGPRPLTDLDAQEATPAAQKKKIALMQALDKTVAGRIGSNAQIDAAIANYELAFRMQTAVPDLMDIKKETEATKSQYGLDHAYEPTRIYGTQCLLARRLVERGVRFIELLCPNTGHDRWDQHGNLKQGHGDNARAVDQPIAALIADLKQRGLWDTTLIIFAGEFGRTPNAQGSDGRDHNPFGFSIWLAGGGVKGGFAYGATDDFGYFATENKTEIYDLHATMLHLMGVDHTKMTVRFGGRDMRLTDVHGNVLYDILA
jgi:hypothetical protein